MNNTLGLREYAVKIFNTTYKPVYAHDRYGALSQGVRLFIKDHPVYTFTMLMSLGSAKLVHPELPGRRSINYES